MKRLDLQFSVYETYEIVFCNIFILSRQEQTCDVAKIALVSMQDVM